MKPVRDFAKIARRLIAVVLLFVVVAHAGAPFVQSFERSSGSAFSAATEDVALACAQPAVAKRTLTSAPALPAVEPRPLTRPASTATPSYLRLAGLLAQTGPPASRTSFSPLAPRAPPAA